jgi:hypothetical protein
MKLADSFALQCSASALLLRPAGTGLASTTEDVSACSDHVAVEGVSHCLQGFLVGVLRHPQGQKVKVIIASKLFALNADKDNLTKY